MELLDATNITQPVICEEARYKEGLASIVVTHLSLALAIIGIMANLLTLIVLRRDTVRGSTNLLLATLATEDILIIISYSLYYVAIHYYENYNLIFLGYLKYADSPIQFILSWVKVTEIYTIVLMSLQRYVAIRWPFRTNRLCSVGRTKRCLIGIFLLSGLLKLPNLIFDYRIMESKPDCELGYLKEMFGQEPWYDTFKIVYIQVLDQVATFIIPSAILVLLNIGLILRVRQASNQKLCEDSFDSIRHRSMKKHTSNQLNQSNPDFNHLISTRVKQPNQQQQQPQQSATFKLNRESSQLHNKFSLIPSQNSGTSGSQSHGHSVTLALIGVISTFLLFETPTTICFAYEFWTMITSNKTSMPESNVTQLESQPSLNGSQSLYNPELQDQQEFQADFYYYAYPAALICILSGCASNFFIYMLIGSKFRRLCFLFLKETFCRSWAANKSTANRAYNPANPSIAPSSTSQYRHHNLQRHDNGHHYHNSRSRISSRKSKHASIPIKRNKAIREKYKRSTNPNVMTTHYFEVGDPNAGGTE